LTALVFRSEFSLLVATMLAFSNWKILHKLLALVGVNGVTTVDEEASQEWKWRTPWIMRT
jgi:hypothetical protein